MIDSHAHIYADEFNDDLEQIVLNAQEVGVSKILLPNIDLKSIKGIESLITKYPGFAFPMMGLHPCSVDSNYLNELELIRKSLDEYNCIAVGEIGVDLYWDKSTQDIQIEAFKIQCDWAIDKDLPIVIHSRDSIDLIIDILENNFKGKITGVFHCFTGSIEQARRIVELGMYVGLGGVLTFKNSDLKTVVPSIPIERIVLETDSPYLAPVPYRGKRNEPSYIIHVHNYLANLLGIDSQKLDAQLEANTLRLFKI
ncbi:MAG: TatD family hydrolase [Bacteroidia bacterium]